MAKTVDLTLHARLKIYYWLAKLPGNAEMQDVFEGIENAIVLSEEEREEVGLQEDMNDEGDLMSAAWKPSIAKVSSVRECKFEDSHAKTLLKLMTSDYPTLRIDREWTRDVIDRLKAVVR